MALIGGCGARHKWDVGLIAMVSVLVLLAVGVSWWQYRDGLSTSDALTGGDRSIGGRTNIPLIGFE